MAKAIKTSGAVKPQYVDPPNFVSYTITRYLIYHLSWKAGNDEDQPRIKIICYENMDIVGYWLHLHEILHVNRWKLKLPGLFIISLVFKYKNNEKLYYNKYNFSKWNYKWFM